MGFSGHSAMPGWYRASWLSSAERDELKLDVIRIPEHHRGVSQGLLLIPDAGVLDAELIEPGRPGRQLLAGGHAEGQVVQARVGPGHQCSHQGRVAPGVPARVAG